LVIPVGYLAWLQSKRSVVGAAAKTTKTTDLRAVMVAAVDQAAVQQ
jgi:hypothetical protein